MRTIRSLFLPVVAAALSLALAGTARAAQGGAPAKDAKAPAPSGPAPAAAPPGPAAAQPVAGGTAAKASPNNPKAVEILNHYIDALGGTKVLDKVEDRMQRFDNTKHAASGDTVASLVQFIKKGYRVREEWNIQQGGQAIKIKDNPLAFTQVYNGVEGWVDTFGTVSSLEGRTLGLFVWDKYLDDSLCHWDEDGYTVEYIGPGKVENEDAEIVEITDFTGAKKEHYYFSKKSGLLLKKEWKEQGQNGLSKKEIAYKKYRAIPFSDGSGLSVQFALLQEVYENNDLDTTREFTEVKVNSGLKDALFERPPGEEFKGGIGGGNVPPAFREGAKPAGNPLPPPVTGHPPIPPAGAKK